MNDPKGLRLVVFADLHLDSSFVWAGPELARNRRKALRQTLRNILDLAEEVRADAILCAGDLYEQALWTPDTREFVSATLNSAGRPVLLAPGNHDHLGPTSLYLQAKWNSNITIFKDDHLQPYELTEGVRLWGGGFQGPAKTSSFLPEDLRLDTEDVNVALFHGSEKGGFPDQGEGKNPYAPFKDDDVERVGLLHAFVGHHHTPRDGVHHTYPGNPDPLKFGERGAGAALVVDLTGNGDLRIRRHPVAVSAVHEISVDLSACNSSSDVVDLLSAECKGLSGSVRILLAGEVAPSIELNAGSLSDFPHNLDGPPLIVTKGLSVGYDLDRISKERSVRGRFVQDVMRAQDLDDEAKHRIIVTGLRAFEGRKDLAVFQ